MRERLLLLLLALLNIELSSQTVSGSEIYYDKTGQYSYKVTAIIYRFCKGPALNSLNGYVIADTFKIPMNFKRVSISKIDDTCGNPCNNLNAAGNWGYEKHVFTDTINFKSSPYDSIVKAGLCQVRFAIHQALRSSDITTHAIHNNQLYNDAMVNICLNYSNVHSPKFSFDPKMLSGCNQNFNYTPGALDTMDFDSLGYELDAAYYDFNKPVTYLGSFTKLIPMTPYCPPNPGVINCRALPGVKPPRGLYFDNELCQMAVTPTKCDEVSTIVFKISEYRRDSSGTFKLLGFVRREMTLTLRTLSDNTLPFKSGSSKYSICGNNQICFHNNFSDNPFLPYQTIPDTVRVYWNKGIPSGTFNITNPTDREKTFQFCWKAQPHYNNERCFFGVKAIDKMCNAQLNTFNFYVQTRGQTSYSTQNIIQSCGWLKIKAVANDTSEKLKGSISISTKSKTIHSTTNMTDSFQAPFNDTFYIKYYLSSNINPFCTVNKTDTVIINNALPLPFEFKNSDTSVCLSYPAQLQFKPSAYSNLSYWEWKSNDTLFNTTDSIFTRDIYFKNKLSITLHDNKGCQTTALRTFTPFKNNTDILPITITTCDSPIYKLSPDTMSLKSPIRYLWTFKNTDTLKSPGLVFYPKNNEKVSLKLEDDNHCKFYDSVYFKVNGLPDFRLEKLLYYQSICINGLVAIPTDSYKVVSPYTIRWQVNGVDSSSFKNSKSFRFFLFDKATVKVILTDANGCVASDSIYFKAPERPIVSLLDTGVHCEGKPFDIYAKVKNNTDELPEYNWYVNGNMVSISSRDSSFTSTMKSNYTLKVKFYGLYGCMDDTSIQVLIHPKPAFKITGNPLYNKANYLEFGINKVFRQYRWSNGDNDSVTGFWAYTLGNPGAYSIRCTVTDSFGCINSDSFSFRTDAYTNINRESSLKDKFYPNPVIDQLVIELLEVQTIRILSTDGKTIFEIQGKTGINRINLGEISSGIYLLEIGERRYKVVKE